MAKQLLSPAALMFLGGIILLAVLSGYSNSKGTEGMGHNASSSMGVKRKMDDEMNAEAKAERVGNSSPQMGGQGAQPAAPAGENGGAASVQGLQTNMQALPTGCSQVSITNPDELLPKGSSNQWSDLNPNANTNLKNMNFLDQGRFSGINMVGQALRNANLQVRSEPPNPQLNVGPWSNTTIEPDLERVPLEIGCGPQ